MANPCQNCHIQPIPDLISPFSRSEGCSAESRWPQNLTQDLSPRQEVASWVRKNYYDTWDSGPAEALPWEMDLQRVTLKFEAVPKDLALSIPIKLPKLLRFLPESLHARLRGNSEASISGTLKVEDNQIPLTMKTLVKFQGIAVMLEGLARYLGLWNGGFLVYNIPDRISVGDYGALHFLTGVSQNEYEDWTDRGFFSREHSRVSLVHNHSPIEFYFPNAFEAPMTAPLGREDPPHIAMCWQDGSPPRHDYSQCCEAVGQQMTLGAFETCTSEDHPLPFCAPFEYPDPENPKLDFGIHPLLPGYLTDWHGRLPESFDLEDLILRFLNRPPKKTSDSFSLDKIQLLEEGRSPEHLLDLLQSGSLELDLAELSDLFIPGVLDLGPSSGKFTVDWSDSRGTLIAETKDLNLQFEAMDFPHRTDGEMAPIRLHAATVNIPYASTAGIRLEWNSETRETDVTLSLQLEADLTLPLLGRVQVSAPLQGSTRLNSRGKLIPGTTTLLVDGLNLRRDHPKAPLDTHLKFLFSDDPVHDGRHYLETSTEHPHFNLALSGSLGNRKASGLDLDAYLPMALSHIQEYQWEALKDDVELNGSLKWLEDGETKHTSYLSLNTFKPMPFNSKESDEDFGVRLNLDVHRGESRDDESLLPEASWLVDGARFQFTRVKLWGPGYENTLRFDADALRLGKLELNDPHFQARISQVLVEDGRTQFAIPRLRFQANSREAMDPDDKVDGMIRGPIEFQLEPCQEGSELPQNLCRGKEGIHGSDASGELKVWWNQAERQLRFENLNLALKAQGIQLPEALKAQQRVRRRELYASGAKPLGRADSLGLDGRVAGHFDFNFDDWSGTGDLRILGDRSGDVYLLDATGKPLEPALISRTNWRFTRFDRFLFDRGFALGRFRLFTRVNTNVLSKFGYSINYETNVTMGHRDVMFKPGGIDEANYAYYRKLLQEILRRGGMDFLQAGEEP